ncbi:unnamed protein product [Gemmata massiliana]|uniref:Uncharacterized protein n=1 Tax=Gemmata massiliana TaxID=1210884 RepID=A0A6P2DHB9_9BACT|nr:hypothetical protein [Gemmata massiliana]VTS00462.1 unnamed protein product [Gemmata massiliana]
MTLESILCVTMRLQDGRTFSVAGPARHPSLFLVAQRNEWSTAGATQGFLTSGRRFVDRAEAFSIALAAGQILYDVNNPPQSIAPTPGMLYSEDVW